MTTPHPLTTAPLRLDIRSGGPHHPLDGAWWPHSGDLAQEATRLVDHFPHEVGRISRILYSTPDWDAPVRKTTTRRGFIKLGTFPDDDTHLVVLLLADHTRRHLLVIAPDTPAAVAESLMAAATMPGNDRSAARLIEDAGLPLPSRG